MRKYPRSLHEMTRWFPPRKAFQESDESPQLRNVGGLLEIHLDVENHTPDRPPRSRRWWVRVNTQIKGPGSAWVDLHPCLLVCSGPLCRRGQLNAL